MPNTFASDAEIIMVKVGDREFKTALDQNGVQRFMPHNEAPAELVEKLKEWEAYLHSDHSTHPSIPKGIYTPNDLAMDFYNGVYTVDEMLSYETSSGYSVCGLAELSYFEDMEIINPLWDKEES